MARMAVALLALAACARAAGKEQTMEPKAWGETVPMCAGRFCADVPKVMERGGRYSMLDVTLQEKVWRPPLDKAFEREWTAQLSKVDDIRGQRIQEQKLRPSSVAGDVVEKRTVAPRFEALCYYQDSKHVVEWIAVRDCGPLGLVLSRWGLAERKDAFAANIVEIGNAYHARDAKEPWPSPGADWFYLDHGAVKLPPREEERMETNFDGLGVRFVMQTETTAEPEKTGPLGRYKLALARLAGDTGTTVVKQDSRRKVAGFTGEELVVREKGNKPPEELELQFGWVFRGEANSAVRPRLALRIETKADREAEKIALWNALLDSVRPVAAR
jgi:Tle cognate immunity protein 4 C-terminal domain